MLVRGSEKLKKIELLISLTSFKSNELKQSLLGYYCVGIYNPKIDKSNFKRAKKKMNQINNIVEQIKGLDYD